MSTFPLAVPSFFAPIGGGSPNKFEANMSLGQLILNLFSGAAERARIAALPRRLLDDVGMVPADAGQSLPGVVAYYPDDIEHARPFV